MPRGQEGPKWFQKPSKITCGGWHSNVSLPLFGGTSCSLGVCRLRWSKTSEWTWWIPGCFTRMPSFGPTEDARRNLVYCGSKFWWHAIARLIDIKDLLAAESFQDGPQGLKNGNCRRTTPLKGLRIVMHHGLISVVSVLEKCPWFKASLMVNHLYRQRVENGSQGSSPRFCLWSILFWN